MTESSALRWLPAVAATVACVGLSAAGASADQSLADGYSDLYFPLCMKSLEVDDLPTARVVTPAPTDEPTRTATATFTPTATATPEPTEILPTGRIHGRMTLEGEPMPAGMGLPLTPQIELRRRVAGEWETIANTVTHEGGTFEFVDPPPLGPGEVYQVMWRNDVETGSDLWLHRWWSQFVAEFGDGTDVDVGVFELADLTYKFPCHDCHRSLPITFEWFPRSNEPEIYRWSLFKGCGDPDDRVNAYRTQSLGHASEYTLSAPPSGFKYDTVYCWYIFIDDGHNGTGWPFHAWRTAFLSLPPVGALEQLLDARWALLR